MGAILAAASQAAFPPTEMGLWAGRRSSPAMAR